MPITFGEVVVTFKAKKMVKCPATYTKEANGLEVLDLTTRQISSIDWAKFAESITFTPNMSKKERSWVPSAVGFWLGPEWTGPRIIISREKGNTQSIFP
jgi:hypothetical protein